MHLRSLLFMVLALAGIVGLLPAMPARSDIPIITKSQVFTASGSLPRLSLAGQSTFSYTMQGGGSATITPEGSSDGGVTYNPITAPGFGAQTSNGVYGGALIPASGAPITTNVYVSVTGVTGSVTVTETITAANIAAAAGASGAPGPTGPSGPPGSPGPAGTISPVPSGSPPINWNASTNVASLSIGTCLKIVGGALTIDLSATNCSPTNNSYDTYMAALATHYYAGNASNCLVDTGTVGGQPLATPTPGSTPGPYPSCGSATISLDREPSIQWATVPLAGQGVGQNYLIIPAAALITSGNFTISWLEESSTPFFGSGNLAAIDFQMDGTNNGNLNSTIENLLQNSGFYGHKLFYGGSGSQGNIDNIGTGASIYVAITEDGTHLNFYDNCDLVMQKSQTTGIYNQGNPGAWGGSQNPASGDTWGGKMAKLAIRTSAVSQATLCTETAMLR